MIEDILSGLNHYIFADSQNDANNIPLFVEFLSNNNYLAVDSQILCIIGADKSQNDYCGKLKITINKIANTNKKSYNLTPIRIEDTGIDAVDKVLIAYVGMAVEKSQNAEFIIVSSDGGYSPVINRLANIGIDIKQQKLIVNKQVNTKTQKQKKRMKQRHYLKNQDLQKSLQAAKKR